MQTFMPEPTFEMSARVLDPKRLRNQRNECKAIMQTILGIDDPGWKHHPAAKQWMGNPAALAAYAITVCHECARRGYPHAEFEELSGEKTKDIFWFEKYLQPLHLPWWMGYEPYHDSHKSNLVRKDPDHYRLYWPDIPDDMEYVWPSKIKNPNE